MAKMTPAQNETRENLSQATFDEKLYAISDYLKKVKFSPRMMGVDEADVWRKLEKLCELYEDALTAERMKSAQLEQDYSTLQKKYTDMKEKSKQLLAAYQKLSGEGREDG